MSLLLLLLACIDYCMELYVSVCIACSPEPTLGIDNTLEVGDAVVVNLSGIKLYGTLKWTGSLPGQDNMAGVEMVRYYVYVQHT